MRAFPDHALHHETMSIIAGQRLQRFPAPPKHCVLRGMKQVEGPRLSEVRGQSPLEPWIGRIQTFIPE